GAVSGAAVVGTNASRSGPEVADDIRHADVDVIVTEDKLAHLLASTVAAVLAPERVWNIDRPAYTQLLAPSRGADPPATLPAPQDSALPLFGSASTGAPTAVAVGQGRLGRLTDVRVDRVRMRRDSVAYLCMPLSHGNAVMMTLA